MPDRGFSKHAPSQVSITYLVLVLFQLQAYFHLLFYFSSSATENAHTISGMGARSLNILDGGPNRRGGHVPYAHGVLAHEGLARQLAGLRGGED